MGAMTNAMGAIGGTINKVGKGVVGGARQVGGSIGVPGMKPPGQPGQPGLAGGGAVTGAIGAAQQGQAGGAPGVPQGPAGGKGEIASGGIMAGQPGLSDSQSGGVATPGGASPPFLPGGLPGMLGQLQKTPQQLTASGALGKQPAQTTMQRMIGGGGGFWKKALMGGGALPYIHNNVGQGQTVGINPRGQQPTAAYDGPAVGSPSWQRAQQQAPQHQPGDLVNDGWGGMKPYNPDFKGVA